MPVVLTSVYRAAAPGQLIESFDELAGAAWRGSVVEVEISARGGKVHVTQEVLK